MLFNDPKRLLDLYNTMSGKNYTNPEQLIINNRAEAMKVSIYEYNEQEHVRMEREDAFEDGRKFGHDEGLAAGRLESLMELLSDLGEIPAEITERAGKLDADTLKQWRRIAARADSMEEFLEKLG